MRNSGFMYFQLNCYVCINIAIKTGNGVKFLLTKWMKETTWGKKPFENGMIKKYHRNKDKFNRFNGWSWSPDRKKRYWRKAQLGFRYLNFGHLQISRQNCPHPFSILSVSLCLSPARKLILSSNYETCQEFAPTEMWSSLSW